MRVLEILAKACAVLAGVLLTGITLMTCASLIGRNTTGWTLVGDFELTGVATGAAIALFMPWCQVRRGNIIVDFFTAKASQRTNDALDRFGALMLAICFAALAWRTSLGGWNAWTTHSESQMLGVPQWIVYAAMVPAFVLTTVIGLWQAAFGFPAEEPEAHA
ncbi:TRAP transporter small permease [Ramlibacter albus]|uniref:TRAP transporter small permease protein n=1 Tax=Ramlibacter albus TaxID=2079448 RepID=A0A923MDC0_9BURK|nr:TRAP transporter small permease [Ramlibacter albus]MBC5768615.1 TRAP transporter small permease [Ramlibacter albus]